MSEHLLKALRAAEKALALIVAECPDREPEELIHGLERHAYEEWGYDSARWEAAQDARPVLMEVRAALGMDPDGIGASSEIQE